MTQVEKTLTDRLAEALEHMRCCGDCAEDDWNFCDGGRAALGALAEYGRTPSPATGSAVPTSAVARDWKALCRRMAAYLKESLVEEPNPRWRDVLITDYQHTLAASPPSASESTVAPKPAGEGQPVAWRVDGKLCDDILHARFLSMDNDCKVVHAIEPLYLAAQAPKPASGGGERELLRLLDSALHALRSYEHGNSSPDLAKEMADHLSKEIGRRLQPIAAEADTAKEQK